MREIKFRIRVFDKEYSDIPFFVFLTIDDLLTSDYLKGDKLSIDEFTGLKDKNGKEIYEGDIIYIPFYNEKVVVTFKDGMFLGNDKYYIKTNDVEIIGNIHENFELIKG